MDKNLIKKGQKINAGNYIVSIGTYKTTDVAIVSKNTGEFVKISNIRKGGKLEKAKRKFGRWLNSKDTFTFEFMQPDTVSDLVDFLKK